MLTSRLLLLAILAVPTLAAADAPTTTTGPATTQASDAPANVNFDGYLAPRDPFEAKVELKKFDGPLKVRQVVAHGGPVKQGETLLSFDTTAIDDQILLAASEVEVATANQTKAEADVALGDRADAAGLEKNTDAVKDAEIQLDYWKKQDGPDFLKQIDMAVKQGQYGIDDQNDELDQLRKMYKSEALTNATADIVVKRAVRALEMSQAAFEIAKLDAEKQKQTAYYDKQQDAERAVAAAHQSLDEFNAATAQSRAQRAAAMTAARVALRAAQRKLSELEQDKAAMTIVTPAEGVAFYQHFIAIPDASTGFFGTFTDNAWRNAKPDSIKLGQTLEAGSTLLTVIKPGDVIAIGKVSDDDVRKLHAGESMKVTIAAVSDEPVDATIASLATLPSADATYEVRLNLAGENAKWMPGMKAKMEVPK